MSKVQLVFDLRVAVGEEHEIGAKRWSLNHRSVLSEILLKATGVGLYQSEGNWRRSFYFYLSICVALTSGRTERTCGQIFYIFRRGLSEL